MPKSLIYLASAAIASILATPVAAQDASATTPKENVGGIADIVVTARKRAESLQTIPVAVSAITAEQIEKHDLTSIEKIAATTPQFTVARASSGSGAQMSMRGIGSTSSSIGIEQSIATVIDGAYSGVGRIIYEGFFDLERVEILKGPQALFFGKNATAGVVSITTADPGDKTEALVRAGYEFGSKRLVGEGIFSTPLTETLGLRIAVRGTKMFGGYYDNVSQPFNYSTVNVQNGATSTFVAPPAPGNEPRERELLGRVTLKWQPTDELKMTLKANVDRNKVNNNSWNYVIFSCATGSSTVDPSAKCKDNNFTLHQNSLPKAIAKETRFAGDGDLGNFYRSSNIIHNLDYRLDKISLTSVTAYMYNKNNWVCACSYQAAPIWATERTTWHAFSNESRLATNYDGPLNLLLGTYYQRTKRIFDQNVLFAGSENSAAPQGLRYVSYSKNSETKGETLSAFGQFNWRFLARFELAGGVRYIRETKNSYFVQPYVNPGLTALFVPNVPVVADQTFSNWSPEATLSYRASESVNIYGAYKTAYKSGGLSNSGIYSALSTTPKDDFVFDPEKAKGFELGVKTFLFDRQLRFNTTIYRYKYTNLQVDFFNAPTFAYLTINAGAAITKGIETEFEFAPRAVQGLTLNGSLNYNRAKYQSFIGPCFAGQSIAAGCPSPTAPGGFPLQDLSGKPTSVAPKWTATAGVDYETSISNALRLGLDANLRYSDTYLSSSLGNELTRIKGYVTLDASARIKSGDKGWELALLGKNLTNRQYFLGSQDAPGTGSGTGTPAAVSADQAGFGTVPRTVELQLTFRY